MEDNMENFMKNVEKFKAYAEANDTVRENKTLDAAEKQKIENKLKFTTKRFEIEEKLENKDDKCQREQNKLAFGIICLLISDAASDYIVEAGAVEETGDGIKEILSESKYSETLSGLTQDITVKISEENIKGLMKHCMEEAKTTCFFENLEEVQIDLDSNVESNTDTENTT